MLRKGIEKLLILITLVLIITTITINDFELKAIPYILIKIAIIIFNIKVLGKYGRGLWLDKNFRKVKYGK